MPGLIDDLTARRRRGGTVARALLACLIAVTTAACWRSPDQGQQLVVGIESETERLDPLTIKNPQTFILSWQIYEGLLGLDEAGQVVPMLAQSWETKDSQTWTFRLRPNVSFQASELFGGPDKSRPVTAADVVWSYTAYCRPTAYSSFLLTDSVKGCADYNAKKATAVEGLRAPDDRTFEITLVKPEPFFINRLTTAWISVFPREAEEPQFKDAWGLRLAVGTGPYRLQSRTDSEVVLVKNLQYWGGPPAIDRIVYRVIKNDQIRFSELTGGKLDLMVVPTQLLPVLMDAQGKPKAEYAGKYNITAIGTFNSHMIGMNLKRVPDIHLRRAMFYGTDRDEIIRRILYGYADVTAGTIPPGLGGYVPLFPGPLYDQERARAELKQSRYRGEDLELLVHELANSEAIGQAFQAQMKAIGLNVKLTKLDFNSVIGRMVKGEATLFSMFLEYVFSAPEPILLNMFTTAKIPVPNFWSYSDASVDQAVEALRTVASREESIRRSAEIEKTIIDGVPAVFLYRQKYVVMYSKKFDGLKVNGHGHYALKDLKLSR